MSNQITVVGNLTREPELRYTPTGAAVVKIGVAVNRFYTNRNGEKVEQTDFFTVNAWRQLAENIAGCSPAPGKPRRARSEPWSRSRPTRWGRRCAGPPHRSPRQPEEAPASGPPPTRRRRPRHRRCTLPRKDTRKDARGGSAKDSKKSARPQRKKVCYFCREKVSYVDFKDVALLRRFVSDRGKIRARRVTGTCSQHQRDVAAAVKSAREVALLPYVIR